MNRYEFMNRLSNLLSDVSESEREEALTYYREYFDDAGILNEQNVINELGSPEQVAATIKEGLEGYTGGGIYNKDNYDKDNYNTDNNYTNNYNTDNDYTNNYNTNNYNTGNYTTEDLPAKINSAGEGGDNKGETPEKKDNTLTIVLIVIACIIGLPVIAGLAGTAIGLISALFGILLAACILVIVLPIAFTVGGIGAIIAGVIRFTTDAAVGVLWCGAGLILIGLGILGFIIFWLYYFKMLPGLFRWIKSLFTKKKGGNQ
ncbi:MAG: DUF1700 domain-containing protein [Lachnospiraceae bacterium]|nr:DUF1700 domain-containing protein [Lachnospiraceae bacterium]